jgi:hypothetical protein
MKEKRFFEDYANDLRLHSALRTISEKPHSDNRRRNPLLLEAERALQVYLAICHYRTTRTKIG